MTLRDCDACGTSYEAKRATSRFCSSRCRQAAHAAGKSGAPKAARVVPLRPTSTPVDGPGPIEAATLAELEAVDRASTAAGRRALMLARLLDDPPPLSLSSVAGWSREHGAALATATAGVDAPRARTPLDLARERRDEKRHA